MSSQVPSTMKALVQHETVSIVGNAKWSSSDEYLQEKRAEVKDHPVPKLDKNEILVKVAYVSQNPTGTSKYLPPSSKLTTALRLEALGIPEPAQRHHRMRLLGCRRSARREPCEW
jgi:hypothetical protein